jgi:serine/threonine protein kinase
MAPEMVIMLDQQSTTRRGYTNAVDWWSLGITVFKLLTGYKPFESKPNQMEEDSLFPAPKSEFPEYALLFQDLVFPRYVSPVSQDFIRQLLDVSEVRRLGYGHNGYEQVMKHPYFNDINWDLLTTKRVEPPYLPTESVLSEIPVYDNFYEMMESEGKLPWLGRYVSPEQQLLFESWSLPLHPLSPSLDAMLTLLLSRRDFIARHTLRVEFGLANEMDQLDRNFKLRQVMGTDVNCAPNHRSPSSPFLQGMR